MLIVRCEIAPRNVGPLAQLCGVRNLLFYAALETYRNSPDIYSGPLYAEGHTEADHDFYRQMGWTAAGDGDSVRYCLDSEGARSVTEAKLAKVAADQIINIDPRYNRSYAVIYAIRSIQKKFTLLKNSLLASLINAELGGRGKVLDIGCNVNAIHKLGLRAGLAAHSPDIEYCGLDIDLAYFDPSLLQFPKLKDWIVDDAGVSVQAASVYDLPAAPANERSMDGIVLADVLEHLTDPRKALEKVHAVLKADGKIFITIPVMYSLDQFKLPRLAGKKGRGHIQFFNEEKITRLLAKTGFTDVRIKGFCYPLSFIFLLYLHEMYVPETSELGERLVSKTDEPGVFCYLERAIETSLSIEDFKAIDESIHRLASGKQHIFESDRLSFALDDIRQDPVILLYLIADVFCFHPDFSARADLQQLRAEIKETIDLHINDFRRADITEFLRKFAELLLDNHFLQTFGGNDVMIVGTKREK